MHLETLERFCCVFWIQGPGFPLKSKLIILSVFGGPSFPLQTKRVQRTDAHPPDPRGSQEKKIPPKKKHLPSPPTPPPLHPPTPPPPHPAARWKKPGGLLRWPTRGSTWSDCWAPGLRRPPWSPGMARPAGATSTCCGTPRRSSRAPRAAGFGRFFGSRFFWVSWSRGVGS